MLDIFDQHLEELLAIIEVPEDPHALDEVSHYSPLEFQEYLSAFE